MNTRMAIAAAALLALVGCSATSKPAAAPSSTIARTKAAPVTRSSRATTARPTVSLTPTYMASVRSYLATARALNITHADATPFSDSELIETAKTICKALDVDGVSFAVRKSVINGLSLSDSKQNALLASSAVAYCPSEIGRAIPPAATRHTSSSHPSPAPTATHQPAPTTHPSAPATGQHSCTTTASGSCIRGGEFCRQAQYGQSGYDADGDRYVCTGDRTHPHWE